MQHFVHSLVKIRAENKIGWCAPAELGEPTPQYISFVIPVDENHGLFDQYVCEAVTTEEQGKRTISDWDLKRNGKEAFVLKVKDRELWFIVRPVPRDERALHYVGKLEHPDFAFPLIEIEPEKPSLLDQLCEETRMFLIGCEPFKHYAGLKERSALPSK